MSRRLLSLVKRATKWLQVEFRKRMRNGIRNWRCSLSTLMLEGLAFGERKDTLFTGKKKVHMQI